MPDIDIARDRNSLLMRGCTNAKGWANAAKSPWRRLAKRHADPLSFGRHSLPFIMARRVSYVRSAADRVPCDPLASARRLSRPGGPRELIR